VRPWTKAATADRTDSQFSARGRSASGWNGEVSEITAALWIGRRINAVHDSFCRACAMQAELDRFGGPLKTCRA
jgi:hypothetical protein